MFDVEKHEMEDNVLVVLSQLIRENLRANDIFARWDTYRFVILLPRTNEDDAYLKSNQLQKIIQKSQDVILSEISVNFAVTEILETDTEENYFKRLDAFLHKIK